METSHARERLERVVLATALPGVAGAVNACGLIAFGIFTSHVTGTVARTSVELAKGHLELARASAELVLAFFVGAVLATGLVDVARARRRARFVVPLLFEAALLLAFAVSRRDAEAARLSDQGLTWLLALAMGLQNALVTRISGADIRTTHVTGILTDLGIEVVHTVTWLRAQFRLHPPRDWDDRFALLFRDPAFRKLRLHLRVLTSFAVGALVGPALWLEVGVWTLGLPCAVLVGLALYDTRFGLSAKVTVPAKP